MAKDSLSHTESARDALMCMRQGAREFSHHVGSFAIRARLSTSTLMQRCQAE